MNWFKKLYRRFNKTVKFAISDPKTFEEVWSFNSNRLRVFSLLLVFIVLLSVGLAYLMSSNSTYFKTNDVSIEREKLEKQNEQIIALNEKMEAQENYIRMIKLILSGEVPVNTPMDSLALKLEEIDLDSLNSKETASEKELSQKVKEDLMTNLNDVSPISYFGSPVTGVISQKFDKKNHPGIDIVTENDRVVISCLSGTVIYSGYTRKDGYILIIEHANDFISVYKHNKRVMKKAGAKVQLGDPVAVVGNTGENTDGPHLHFELWYDQLPVNPEDYIQFTR